MLLKNVTYIIIVIILCYIAVDQTHVFCSLSKGFYAHGFSQELTPTLHHYPKKSIEYIKAAPYFYFKVNNTRTLYFLPK